MPKDVSGYLSEQQRKSSGDVATEWGKIEELYNKKYVYMIIYMHLINNCISIVEMTMQI